MKYSPSEAPKVGEMKNKYILMKFSTKGYYLNEIARSIFLEIKERERVKKTTIIYMIFILLTDFVITVMIFSKTDVQEGATI